MISYCLLGPISHIPSFPPTEHMDCEDKIIPHDSFDPKDFCYILLPHFPPQSRLAPLVKKDAPLGAL